MRYRRYTLYTVFRVLLARKCPRRILGAFDREAAISPWVNLTTQQPNNYISSPLHTYIYRWCSELLYPFVSETVRMEDTVDGCASSHHIISDIPGAASWRQKILCRILNKNLNAELKKVTRLNSSFQKQLRIPGLVKFHETWTFDTTMRTRLKQI